MSGNTPSVNPLSYAGILPNNPPNQIRNNRPPNSTDINANIGDEWEDYSVTPSNFWKLANLFFNRATWVMLSAGTGLMESLSDTANTPVFPSSSISIPPNNIQLVGTAGQINIVATPASHLLTFSLNGSFQGSVTTNGLQTKTVLSIPTTALSTNTIEARISGYGTPIGVGINAGIGGFLSATFISGSISTTSIDVPDIIQHSFLSTTATYTATGSGLNIDITVTGDALYNINWTCTATNQIAS